MVSLRLNPEYGWKRLGKEPCRLSRPGAQEANGEGRDQGRDRGRPASPRARPGHAGYVRPVIHPWGAAQAPQTPPPEAKQGRTYANSVCSAQSQSQSESFEQKARLDVSPKPREARADQERLRRPSGGVRHVAGGWGRAPPATSPERGGRSWASRPSRCAVAARALTPIHSDSAPPSPCAGLWRVFRVKGGSRGWCGPQPRRGEDTAPDATGRPKPAGRVSGALFPGTPAPRRRPRQDRRRRL